MVVQALDAICHAAGGSHAIIASSVRVPGVISCYSANNTQRAAEHDFNSGASGLVEETETHVIVGLLLREQSVQSHIWRQTGQTFSSSFFSSLASSAAAAPPLAAAAPPEAATAPPEGT